MWTSVVWIGRVLRHDGSLRALFPACPGCSCWKAGRSEEWCSAKVPPSQGAGAGTPTSGLGAPPGSHDFNAVQLLYREWKAFNGFGYFVRSSVWDAFSKPAPYHMHSLPSPPPLYFFYKRQLHAEVSSKITLLRLFLTSQEWSELGFPVHGLWVGLCGHQLRCMQFYFCWETPASDGTESGSVLWLSLGWVHGRAGHSR